MTAPYFEAVRQLIKDKTIPPEKLVLEISEKTPIAEPVNGCGLEVSLMTFRERLENYVETFQIAFAIDDFGAGHASTTCLNRLRPEYVKIDRDVLLQDYGHHTIRFVLDLVGKYCLRGSKVVVEGYDNNSRIPLDVLYKIGVRYVQGYTVAKASPTPNDLKLRHKKYLSRLIAGSGARLKLLQPKNKDEVETVRIQTTTETRLSLR